VFAGLTLAFTKDELERPCSRAEISPIELELLGLSGIKQRAEAAAAAALEERGDQGRPGRGMKLVIVWKERRAANVGDMDMKEEGDVEV